MRSITYAKRGKVRIILPDGHTALLDPRDAIVLADSLILAGYKARRLAAPSVHIRLREALLRCEKLDRKLKARSNNLGRARRSERALSEIRGTGNFFGYLNRSLVNSITTRHLGDPS